MEGKELMEGKGMFGIISISCFQIFGFSFQFFESRKLLWFCFCFGPVFVFAVQKTQ
jgi:hypothetical protein